MSLYSVQVHLLDRRSMDALMRKFHSSYGAQFVLGLSIVMAVAGCTSSSSAPIRETVLRPGQSVEATNKFGRVRITYVSPAERTFEWDGRSRTVKLIPRPERFMGMLGLYDPADQWIWEA
ncbi:MAG TPA: hypothetical protein VF474_13315, partial [Phenylobacterium sp.]